MEHAQRPIFALVLRLAGIALMATMFMLVKYTGESGVALLDDFLGLREQRFEGLDLVGPQIQGAQRARQGHFLVQLQDGAERCGVG